jgi:hypothetical protein
MQHQLIPVAPTDVTKRLLELLEKDRVDAIFYANPEILGLFQAELKGPLELECRLLEDANAAVYMAFSKSLPAHIEARLNSSLKKLKVRKDFARHLQNLLETIDVSHLKVLPGRSQAFEISR